MFRFLFSACFLAIVKSRNNFLSRIIFACTSTRTEFSLTEASLPFRSLSAFPTHPLTTTLFFSTTFGSQSYPLLLYLSSLLSSFFPSLPSLVPTTPPLVQSIRASSLFPIISTPLPLPPHKPSTAACLSARWCCCSRTGSPPSTSLCSGSSWRRYGWLPPPASSPLPPSASRSLLPHLPPWIPHCRRAGGGRDDL